MQPRRRLPLLAGMALSTVIIAAPAAHADDFLRPRQDCSETRVKQAHRGEVIDDILDLVKRQDGDVDDVEIRNRKKNKMKRDGADITIDDSFNCSNTFNRSFRHKFRERRHHGYGHNDWSDKR